jgi:hypothetical protein
MGRLEDRLKRLEAGTVEETPWWTLPPGEDPTWPRPLRHLSVEELEAIYFSSIDDYLDALDEGRELRKTPEETYTRQEAWHELRWRKHRIARRKDLPGLARPEGWEPPQNNDERSRGE